MFDGRVMTMSLPEVQVSEDELAESGWRAFPQLQILEATLSSARERSKEGTFASPFVFNMSYPLGMRYTTLD
jgi:hypothetical protein